MPRYRKRPIVVEAEQWFPGKNIPGVKFWPAMLDDGLHDGPYVTTIQEQHVSIKAGEWVIQEGDGMHAYPCDPTEFKRIYEPCPAPDDPAPATFCGHGVNQDYPCLECQAAGIAAPASTTKEGA